MDSADDRLDEKESKTLSLRERIFFLASGDSNWSRNYGWQLLSFTSLILGIGFYFIFVNSPIKAVRLMPNVPKTYGTYARPVQIPPIPDDDTPRNLPQADIDDKQLRSDGTGEPTTAAPDREAQKDNAPQ